MNFWQFADANPGVASFMLFLLLTAIVTIIMQAFNALNTWKNGWKPDNNDDY